MEVPSLNVHEKNTLQSCGSAPSTDRECPKQNFIQSLPSPEPRVERQKFSFRLVLILLAAYLGVGTLCFSLIRNQFEGEKTNGVLDAIYFCVVTMTTVGYGDLVPHSVLAKLLACIYVFSGMALVGLILSKAADYIVDKQEILLVGAIKNVGPTEIPKEVKTHKAKYKFLMATAILFVLMIVGIAFLTSVENLKFIDAFYLVCTTITTLGYGDLSFSTKVGRIFAVFWILSSTICLAQFFLYLAELLTEKEQRALVDRILKRRMTPLDIEAADLDRNKVVSPAEFAIYKLKEMGKISEEDISLVMERFKNLDVDHSGNWTKQDLLSQSSEAT